MRRSERLVGNLWALLGSLMLCIWVPSVRAQQSAPANSAATPSKPTTSVQALLDKGQAAAKAYQWEEALRQYQAALERARTDNDPIGQANTLANIGNVYRITGQPQKALEFLQQALPIYKAVGKRIQSVAMPSRNFGEREDFAEERRIL